MNTDQLGGAPVTHPVPAGRLRGVALRCPAVAILALGMLAGCSTATSSNSPTHSPAPAASLQRTADASAGAEATIDMSHWITLAPDGAGFTVKMPGQWQASQMALPGTGTQLSWSVLDQKGRSFGVTVLNGFDPAAAASGRLTVTPKKVISETTVTVNGHAGKASALDFGPGVDRTETFVIGGKTYSIDVWAPAGYDDAGLAQAFFDTFVLTV